MKGKLKPLLETACCNTISSNQGWGFHHIDQAKVTKYNKPIMILLRGHRAFPVGEAGCNLPRNIIKSSLIDNLENEEWLSNWLLRCES